MCAFENDTLDLYSLILGRHTGSILSYTAVYCAFDTGFIMALYWAIYWGGYWFILVYTVRPWAQSAKIFFREGEKTEKTKAYRIYTALHTAPYSGFIGIYTGPYWIYKDAY